MTFNQSYYRFIFCQAPINQVVSAMCKFLKKMERPWGGLLSGKYNQKLVDSTCYNNANFYIAPKSRMLFFVPSIAPGFTVGTITATCSWYVWLGCGDPTFERLALRFTTTDKHRDAIRELALYCEKNVRQRFIRVMKNDPKWELMVDGEPQPFEEGKSFEKVPGKRIKDYFTLDDMIRFVNNWGCPFDKDEFWVSDQPMYVFGELDDDDNLADWKEEDFEAWKKWPEGF
jgi:hypothetical protein